MHQKEATHSDGSYEKKSCRRAWLKKWDKVKIQWYRHRLMHRKRVTCELHDSYFRLVTIKHAIPKIEWAIELLYNSVKTGSQWVGEDVVGKATTWQKGHWDPPSEFGDQTGWWEDAGMRTCPREAGPPGHRLSSPGERERHTAMSGGARVVNMLQSLFGLQLPLTRKPYNKVRGIFLKEDLPRLYSLCHYDPVCILHMYMYYVFV